MFLGSKMFEGLEWIFCPLLERLRASRKVFEDQLQLLCTKWSLEGTQSCSWNGWNSWNILDRILKLVGSKTLKLVGSNLRTQNYQYQLPVDFSIRMLRWLPLMLQWRCLPSRHWLPARPGLPICSAERWHFEVDGCCDLVKILILAQQLKK